MSDTKLILLTGATGFVGRHVLRGLLKHSKKVRLIVREDSVTNFLGNKGIEKVITTRDMFQENISWWKEVFEDVDTVVHLAWYAEPGKYLQSLKNLDCLIGTVQMAKGAVEAGIRRFVAIGTCLEYDLNYGLLSSKTPLRPVTTYAGAKAATFFSLSQYLLFEKVEFAWCRLFYLYGEGEDRRRLVSYIRNKLSLGQMANLTSGNQIRDYMDVKEASKFIVKVTLSDFQGAANVCSGVPITIRRIAESIADEYGRRDLLNFSEKNTIGDPLCVIGVRTEIKKGLHV
jgi:dTDP-6-deoxy-L-talose 4-dehydrogenase (NAD+)